MSSPKVLARACLTCRARKIKCDTVKPNCGQCLSNNRKCEYSFEPPKRRPTRAVINTLQTQKRALEETIATLKLASPEKQQAILESISVHDGNVKLPEDVHPSSQFSYGQDDRQVRSPNVAAELLHNEDADGVSSDEDLDPVNFLSVDQTGQIGAFGPSSSLHDPLDVGGHIHAPPSDQFRHQLIASAALQRQQEHVLRTLPEIDGVPSELAMHLLDLHWNRQHHSFLLTYRPAIMRDLIHGGPYCSLFLLNAIFACSSKFSERLELREDVTDPDSAGKRFFRRCDELLDLNHSTLSTAIGLLLLGSTWVARSDTSRGWLYTGYALRMVYDLGLHLDCNEVAGNAEDIEIRRRVFWGAFICDKLQSLYLGRPISIQLRDAHVSRDFMDTMEEMELWSPYVDPAVPDSHGSSWPVPVPCHSVTTFQQLCLLSKIMTKIINRFYVVGASADKARSSLQSVDDNLISWYEHLPDHLKFEPWLGSEGESQQIRTPNVIILLTTYHSLAILLHRPFISNGHLRSARVSANSWRRCTTAARCITSLVLTYKSAYSLRRAPYLLSYATYVACTIHVRNAAVSEVSRNKENTALIVDTLGCLDEMVVPNSGVANPAMIIRKLMAANGIGQSSEPLLQSTTPSSFDLDAILQMFPDSGMPANHQAPWQQNLESRAPDLLFGFMDSSVPSPQMSFPYQPDQG